MRNATPEERQAIMALLYERDICDAKIALEEKRIRATCEAFPRFALNVETGEWFEPKPKE